MEPNHMAKYSLPVLTDLTENLIQKKLLFILFDRFVAPSSGYSASPVEVLAPTLLGRAEEGNFPWWERVRYQLEHPGMTREQLIYLDHLSELDSATELSIPVSEIWDTPPGKV
jgi:hypothetical protein